MMPRDFSDYGLWWLVAINSLIFIVFAFSFFRPKTSRDWRSFGAFSAFLIALFTEMYGFPLTIFLLSGWLTSRFPDIDWYAHDSGHLLEMLFGWGGNPHIGPFHLLSSLFVYGGFILLAVSWRMLYRAQRAHTAATTGPYALVRHPQYAAFISIMFGFLLQWPTLPTLIMFPILVYMYVRLARREERESSEGLGEEYRDYLARTPAFLPSFGAALRLAAVGLLIFGLPVLFGYLVIPQEGADAAMPHMQADGVIAKQVEDIRAQVQSLKEQMRALDGDADTLARRDLVLAHLDALREFNENMHAMNLKVLADPDKRRVVGDPGLKQRLQLDAEVKSMQLEMLAKQMGHAAPRAVTRPAVR